MLPEAEPGNVVGHASEHGNVTMVRAMTLVAGEDNLTVAPSDQYQPPTCDPSVVLSDPAGAMIDAAGPKPTGSVSTPSPEQLPVPAFHCTIIDVCVAVRRT